MILRRSWVGVSLSGTIAWWTKRRGRYKMPANQVTIEIT